MFEHLTPVLRAVLVVWTAPTVCLADAGDLDQSFGNGGLVTTDFRTGSDRALAVTIQTDGRIVVAGFSIVIDGPTGVDFALARYNPDGSLDVSFGSGGLVTTDFASLDDIGFALLIQADGRIVVAGGAHSGAPTGADFALARYNADGTPDVSFGNRGLLTTDFTSGNDAAAAVAMQADGRIVVAGTSNTFPTGDDFALARYNPDGSLDASFGNGGLVTTDFASLDELGLALAIQADGRIVVAGGTGGVFPAIEDFALARYNPDGTLDTSFGSGGLLTTDFGSQLEFAQALAVQADGRIVAAGGTAVNRPPLFFDDFALARYNPDGSLDASFGSGGLVTTDFASGTDSATGVAIQGDGLIVVAGTAFLGGGGNFALARYNPDGTLDASFGSGGLVTTDFASSEERGGAVAIQTDGRIVVAGMSSSDFALARYLGAACPWDLDGGGVGRSDLQTLIDAWGTNPGGPPDFDGDGVVAVPDLLTLLAAWGTCQ